MRNMKEDGAMLTIEQRKQSWLDLQDMSSPVDRVLVVSCDEVKMPERPLLWWELAKERVAWSYERYQKQLENMEWLDDSTVPSLSMETGTEIFAEAFGCKVHRPLDNNPFALPLIRDVSEFSKIKLPRLEDTKLSILFDMADKLRELAGKDVLLSLPDMQTPMDISALIWEKSDFFVAMYEEPEAVRELSAMVYEFVTGFLDQWFARYGKSFIAHFPHYYMEYGVTMSEDEIGAVSPEMYREFFEPELNALSERYGAIGIHCCADSKHQWENLKRVKNLKLLNLHREAEETAESLEFFHDFVAQYPGYSGVEVPGVRYHMANAVSVATKKEAVELVKRVRERTGA